MGHLQHNFCNASSTRSKRLRPRVCLRCDCGRVYQPCSRNQRYCQDPHCQKEVDRWQAVKRQQRRRNRPEVREAHAAAERKRRARLREEARTAIQTRAGKSGEHDPHHHSQNCSLSPLAKADSPLGNREPSRLAESSLPGLSALTDWPPHDSTLSDRHQDCCPILSTGIPRDEDPSSDGGAWSRSKRIPSPFCNRPRCYQAVRDCTRRQARYCSDECRQAMKRVHDRERKWKVRNTEAGRYKRSLEYQAAREARRVARCQLAAAGDSSPTTCGQSAVANIRSSPEADVSCHDRKEVPTDGREKTVGRRPRAPPS